MNYHVNSYNLLEPLFLAYLNIRKYSTPSTPSLLWLSITALKNTFIYDSLPVVVGNVHRLAGSLLYNYYIYFLMLSFYGYTWAPHFIACRVYSCPLNIEQSLSKF